MSIKDRYQWLFRKSPAMTVSLNEEGYMLDASDAWLRRFGYTREEIADLRPQDLGSPESARRIVEAHRGTIELECPREGGTMAIVRLPAGEHKMR